MRPMNKHYGWRMLIRAKTDMPQPGPGFGKSIGLGLSVSMTFLFSLTLGYYNFLGNNIEFEKLFSFFLMVQIESSCL